MSTVDILIPCYNYGRFLDACVQSVLSQSIKDVRVLIIDDASTDDSAKVAERLARDDKRVSLSVHEQNRGHIRTYNEGIAWAEGDYFLLLSADDLLVPNALARAVTVMDSNPDVGLTYGACAVWHDNSAMPRLDRVSKPFSWDRVNLVQRLCETGVNFVPTPTAICRTSVQKAIGGYRQELPHAGDLEMWLRFGAHGGVACINSVQGIYRKHDRAMSNAYWAQVISDYQQRRLAFDMFFESDRRVMSPQLKKQAKTALADSAFQNGINAVRRGRLNDGAELVKWSMATDPDWRRLGRLWRILKWPGADGWHWAGANLKGLMARKGAPFFPHKVKGTASR